MASHPLVAEAIEALKDYARAIMVSADDQWGPDEARAGRVYAEAERICALIGNLGGLKCTSRL